jgi:hypothetical protein
VSRRRAPLALLVAGLVLVLAACTGMPTSGPVNPGLPAAEDSSSLQVAFLPDRPQPGATPDQIVDGFIRAGSGPADNWRIAREYLAPSIRDTWQPTASVTVDQLPARALALTAEDAVTVQLTPTALVDADGAYSVSDAGPTSISFQLAQQQDGQWRITKAPDGIVLDSDTFSRVYHSYSLMYFDPSWRYLVPDVRWYPSLNAATRIVAALVEGRPSPWLRGSVATSFPDDLGVRASVPIVDGAAQVELGAAALALPAGTLDRMQTQLNTSLATASITEVRMTVGGAPLTANPVKTASTSVDQRALVEADGVFGFITGGEIEPVPGLSAGIQALDARSVQTSSDGLSAVVRVGDGTIVRVPSAGATTTVDTRPGLVDPTVDPDGYVWTVPADAPAAVQAIGLQGDRVAVAAAWPTASRIAAMQLSRDGARVAAVVAAGGRWYLWVAGVVRDETGAPVSLGAAQELAVLGGVGVAVAWIDDRTLGVVSRSTGETTVLEQPVGGIALVTSLPAEVDAVSGANQAGVVRLRGTDGGLYLKRGTNWQLAAGDVQVLATSQGLIVAR